MDPLLGIVDVSTTYVKHRGQMKENHTYTLSINRYFETGIVYRVMKLSEFEKIQAWQNETGIQVIYPYVESKDISGITDNPNIWYQVSDAKGTPVLDADGNFIPAYSTNQAIEGAPYDSIRVEGDDGSYIYSAKKAGSVQARICYYNYYIYLNGREPTYVFRHQFHGPGSLFRHRDRRASRSSLQSSSPRST